MYNYKLYMRVCICVEYAGNFIHFAHSIFISPNDVAQKYYNKQVDNMQYDKTRIL